MFKNISMYQSSSVITKFWNFEFLELANRFFFVFELISCLSLNCVLCQQLLKTFAWIFFDKPKDKHANSTSIIRVNWQTWWSLKNGLTLVTVYNSITVKCNKIYINRSTVIFRVPLIHWCSVGSTSSICNHSSVHVQKFLETVHSQPQKRIREMCCLRVRTNLVAW